MTDQTTDLLGEQMTESWTRAVQAQRRGDRITAEIEWSDALAHAKRVSSPGPYELCWRVMILYQRASNLALLHRLDPRDGGGDRARPTTVRTLWLELVDYASQLDREARAVFAELHNFDISLAVGVARRELFSALEAARAAALDAAPYEARDLDVEADEPHFIVGPDLPAASGL